MVNKLVLFSLILLVAGFFILPNPALSQSVGTGDSDGQHGDSDLREFIVSPHDSLVSAQTEYTLNFKLSGLDAWDLIDGSLRFSFPEGFDLADVRLERFDARCGVLRFVDDGFSISGQTIVIDVDARFDDGSVKRGPGSVKSADGTPLPLVQVEFTIRLERVQNPPDAGQYSLAGVALDEDGKTTAGPTVSRSFPISSVGVADIELTPDTALTLRAGEVQQFTARAVDVNGNEIPDVSLIYSLSDDGDPIGELTDATLLATTVGVGRIVVRTADPSLFFETTSEAITVQPGPLDEIVLDIASDQVVGAPIRGGDENVIFYDRYGNRKTDLNLESSSLALDVSSGAFSPNVFTDQSLLVNGAIDLASTRSSYFGPTAEATVRAVAGGIEANTETAWFHGYDVIAINDITGSPITQIIEGTATELQILVQNNGRQAPSQLVQLTVGYGSFNGDSAIATFVGRSNGLIDTIAIVLPPFAGDGSSTSITARLDWLYTFDGDSYDGFTDRAAPVTVVPEIAVFPISGSFAPDTAVTGSSFDFGIWFLAPSFSGPIDDALLAVTLTDLDDPGTAAVIFDNSAPVASFVNDTITHAGLPVNAAAYATLPSGDYSVTVEYTIVTGGTVITVPATVMDTISLLAGPAVTYVESSFSPTTVFADRASSFVFDVQLISDVPLQLAQPAGTFTLTGNNFSATVSLFAAASQLTPGENMLTSDLVFVPVSLAGTTLSPQATIHATLPGVSEPIELPVDLSGVVLTAVELPLIRIVSLDAVAPNAPRVNTDQTFALRCAVENLASAPVGPVTLELVSDGRSTFDSSITIDIIPANDTAVVEFAAVAASQPDQAEVFQIFIDPGAATEVAPIDNIALVTIEDPAELTLEYDLIGDANGLVGRGEEFTLSVLLRNIGQAAAGLGRYEISTGGIDFGLEEFSGVITPGQNLSIPLVAPDIDTTAVIEFTVTDVPLDANSRQPAILRDTSFSVTVEVQSTDGDVLVEIVPVGSPLVVPGRQQELFDIILINRGTAEVTVAELEEITIAVSSSGADADQLLDEAGTHLLEDGTPVAVADVGRDDITLVFEDWRLGPEEQRRLRFVTELRREASGQFSLRLERDDFSARFVQGPLAGLPVDIASPDGNNIVFDQQYRVRGATIDESFVIEDNPFNPRVAPARFAYELPRESGIEFRVFTLTGELVYSRDLPQGAPGTEPNVEQFIEWSGANGPGDIVMNGVYIVSLRVVATGETVQRKVVVLK